MITRTNIVRIEISSLNCVENECPKSKSSHNNAIDQTLLPGEPFHGHCHGRGIGQGNAQAKHEPIGEGGEGHADLDGEVGEEDSGGHDGTTHQHGAPHSDPLLQVTSEGHECSLTKSGQGRDPDGVRVEFVLLNIS